MKVWVLLGILCTPLLGTCQYYQYSQYSFTDQRVSPSFVASSDYASVNLLHREQKTGGDFNIQSNCFSLAYPFLHAKNRRRWSGMGLTFNDDRTSSIFNTQEVALSYAINVYMGRRETLSLGTKGLYHKQRVNLDGFYTGSQYIPDRGFDPSLQSGEGFRELQQDFFTFSMGVHWQKWDRQNRNLASLSFAFFDFNKTNSTYLNNEKTLNGTMVGSVSFRIYQQGAISISPEGLYTYSAGNYVVNIGAVTRYDILTIKNASVAHIDLITKIVTGRSGIIGLQFVRDNFSVGMSYDFPFGMDNIGNTGALELGISLKRLVDPQRKSKSARKRKEEEIAENKKEANKRTPPTRTAPAHELTATNTLASKPKPDLKETLKAKQDSILTNTAVGTIVHGGIVLEKATLRFGFDFNSAHITEESSTYLDDLAAALMENEKLRIELTGHTDNIGSEKFNLKLSVNRAQAIQSYLIEQGVDPDIIQVSGKGMSEPIAENNTAENRALNRRVELKIIYEDN